MNYYESRVRLDFDATWTIVAFDQTNYFKALAGQGLRGVDFVGFREQTLYLIEIKNYSPAKKMKRYRYGADPGELVVQLHEKFVDSQRIVRIIESTLQRHLLYRIWRRITRHRAWLKSLGPADWAFWTRCAELASYSSVQNVLLLIDPLGQINTDTFPEDWRIIRGQPPFSALPGLTICNAETINRA